MRDPEERGGTRYAYPAEAAGLVSGRGGGSPAVAGRGGAVSRAVAPPPVESPPDGSGPPREGGGEDGGGGGREHHRLLVLVGVYTRARLGDRRGRRVPRRVGLRRVREVSGLPAAYVEELVAEMVEEGYLEYRPDTCGGRLGLVRRTVRMLSRETTCVSLTERGFDYPGLDRACELLLGGHGRREEVVHHLTMPRRFAEDLRSEDEERREYARSMAVCLGACALLSLAGSVALVLEVVI